MPTITMPTNTSYNFPAADRMKFLLDPLTVSKRCGEDHRVRMAWQEHAFSHSQVSVRREVDGKSAINRQLTGCAYAIDYLRRKVDIDLFRRLA